MTLSKRVQGIWGEAGMVGKAQLWFQSNPDDRTSLRMVSSLREKVGGVNTPENEKGFALTKGKNIILSTCMSMDPGKEGLAWLVVSEIRMATLWSEWKNIISNLYHNRRWKT